MSSLAVIIPYLGEFPHLHYTLQSLCNELRGYIDFEVVLVQNQLEPGGVDPNTGENYFALEALLKGQDTSWLKQIAYADKPSHWGCKNLAIKNTDAPFLFFLDAHCLLSAGTLRDMFVFYRDNWEWLNGSLHLPISDFLKTDAKEYKLLYDLNHGLLHYENRKPAYSLGIFTDLLAGAIQRPCMSTCGMLIKREFIEEMNCWPDELGPYGGGENYYNFVSALFGRKIYIYPSQPLWHWHIPGQWSRDYRPTYDEWARNIMIATYLVGGIDWLERLAHSGKALPSWHPVCFTSQKDLRVILDEIRNSEGLRARREMIESKAVTTIEEWAETWRK